MEDLYIYHKKFGKCKVVALFRDVALVELKNNVEKYVVTIGLSKKNNAWLKGMYYKTFDDALSAFGYFLQDFYEVII